LPLHKSITWIEPNYSFYPNKTEEILEIELFCIPLPKIL